jgi:hypothetical protein
MKNRNKSENATYLELLNYYDRKNKIIIKYFPKKIKPTSEYVEHYNAIFNSLDRKIIRKIQNSKFNSISWVYKIIFFVSLIVSYIIFAFFMSFYEVYYVFVCVENDCYTSPKKSFTEEDKAVLQSIDLEVIEFWKEFTLEDVLKDTKLYEKLLPKIHSQIFIYLLYYSSFDKRMVDIETEISSIILFISCRIL